MLYSTVLEQRPFCVDLSSGSGLIPKTGSSFELFVCDAVVSLVGCEECVSIKLLRDTGAKHSFIVESVLSFSPATETGDFVLMQGMELGLIPSSYCAGL